MIESYIVLAGRIRKELEDIERLVSRANRAINTAQKNPQDTDLYIDSAYEMFTPFHSILSA